MAQKCLKRYFLQCIYIRHFHSQFPLCNWKWVVDFELRDADLRQLLSVGPPRVAFGAQRDVRGSMIAGCASSLLCALTPRARERGGHEAGISCTDEEQLEANCGPPIIMFPERVLCCECECASNKHTATHVTHKNTLRMEREKKKRLKGGAREKTKRHL